MGSTELSQQQTTKRNIPLTQEETSGRTSNCAVGTLEAAISVSIWRAIVSPLRRRAAASKWTAIAPVQETASTAPVRSPA